MDLPPPSLPGQRGVFANFQKDSKNVNLLHLQVNFRSLFPSNHYNNLVYGGIRSVSESPQRVDLCRAFPRVFATCWRPLSVFLRCPQKNSGVRSSEKNTTISDASTVAFKCACGSLSIIRRLTSLGRGLGTCSKRENCGKKDHSRKILEKNMCARGRKGRFAESTKNEMPVGGGVRRYLKSQEQQEWIYLKGSLTFFLFESPPAKK